MRILGMGLDWKGQRLYPPVEESDFSKALREGLEVNRKQVGEVTRSSRRGVEFRGEMEAKVVNPADAKTAGWTILIAEKDARRDAILEALRPLAVARGMKDPAKPLVFTDGGPESWHPWLVTKYHALGLKDEVVPAYVLIAGDPSLVPFGFQSLLDQSANVGRLDFEKVEDFATYAAKLLRLEQAPDPVVTRDALFFAPDAGMEDPTFFSRKYMAEPLAKHVRDQHKLATTLIAGDDATKPKLLDALRTSKAGLVYTASHGLGAFTESAAVQAKFNGAICCQSNGGPLTPDALFAAQDIPTGQPFLEGAVFFQFACFGYGTPAVSEYAHWLKDSWGKARKQADRDFVAALPRGLLAHPRGPIAFIGHLDTAFLHAFADASQPHTVDRWHARIAPFKKAVDKLLGVLPSGLAMEGLNTRYAECNAVLTTTADMVQRGTMQWDDENLASFLDTWITRGDAQNYMVFGDPAARLRLPG